MATSGEKLRQWKQANANKVSGHDAAYRQRRRIKREAMKAAATATTEATAS